MRNNKSNKFLLAVLFFFVFIFIFSFQATATGETDLYFFWGDGCPHCSNAKPFLEKLKTEYPNLNIKSYEIYKNEDNKKLFAALGDVYAEDIRGVPAFFIGDDAFAGYTASMNSYIRQLVENCVINNCESPIEKLNKKKFVNINQNSNQNNQTGRYNTKLNSPEKSEQDSNIKFIFLSIFIVLIASFIFLKKIRNSK
ncbi:MAG: thioredoxin family protein [Patescibacteria group bacterium]|nr:thioredoxin family protein [Patescibacteria group bacterium]